MKHFSTIVKRLGARALEIFMNLNNINQNYMKYIFSPKVDARLRPNDILVKSHKTVNYGNKV